MLPNDLPELAIVRVLTPGGPYALGDTLSVAYSSPTIGRLVAHDAPGPSHHMSQPTLIPDTISVRVVHAASPYITGDILTLSFVDPRVARIHPTTENRNAIEHGVARTAHAEDLARELEYDRHEVQHVRAPESEILTADLVQRADLSQKSEDEPPNSPMPEAVDRNPDIASTRTEYDPDGAVDVAGQRSSLAIADIDGWPETGFVGINGFQTEFDISTRARGRERSPFVVPSRNRVTDAVLDDENIDTRADIAGVRVRLNWSPDRVRRFVQVVDKLFTVDRLGWYRHAFAMRLLVPDDISCGDPIANIEATRHLVALRAAAVETLGRPLLAAFMPSFTVTSDWLDSLDSPAAARAVAGLRETIAPHVRDASPKLICDDANVTVGIVERRAFETQPASTVESILPIFIASDSSYANLAERLGAYRRTLVDVFGQTASSADAVRLNGMAQPNHSLDDRLWQLVGAVGESLGGLAVA